VDNAKTIVKFSEDDITEIKQEIFNYVMLPAFTFQVPKWTGDSGSNPEQASFWPID